MYYHPETPSRVGGGVLQSLFLSIYIVHQVHMKRALPSLPIKSHFHFNGFQMSKMLYEM